LTDKYSAVVVIAASQENPVLITNDPTTVREISFIISVERPGRSLNTGDYRTMRARDISTVTAPLDLLFPDRSQSKPYFTVGIGDGGNEIGMWNCHEKVEEFIESGSNISVSTGCDILIVCGVSNWGALAVAAAAIVFFGNMEDGKWFVELCSGQREILRMMLDAGSYDGCSGEREEMIDGMAFGKEHLEITKEICSTVSQFFGF
jgi:hypothetical protein